MRRLKTKAVALFSIGLALGVVQRERTGRYVAPRSQNKVIRLSAQKERAAALMGMDASTCREVERRIERMLAQEGAEKLRARLDAYTTTTSDLADWEIANIRSFDQAFPEPQPQPGS
jgi:hypothetical protein